MSHREHLHISLDHIDLLRRGDLNAAWEAVNGVFEEANAGLNIYEVPMAYALVDSLRDSQGFNGEPIEGIGLLALRTYPENSKHKIPKVFGATEELIEGLDASGERVVMVRNKKGELWRTLHVLNARGFDALSQQAGSSDLIIEGTKLSESESTMLELWARRQLKDGSGFLPDAIVVDDLGIVPHTRWLLRLLTEQHTTSLEMKERLRDCDIKVAATAEQPKRLFNEKLEGFIDRETTRLRVNGGAYTVDRAGFDTFTDNLERVYRHIGNYSSESPVLMSLSQDQSIAAITGVFRLRLYEIGKELAEAKSLGSGDLPVLLERIKQHDEESVQKLRAYIFTNKDAQESTHENNAVLVPSDFIDTLWETMDSRFGDNVVLASHKNDFDNPYAVIWYGERYLLTFVPSTIAEHTWLHIDSLPATEVSDDDIAEFREVIGKQLGKDSE